MSGTRGHLRSVHFDNCIVASKAIQCAIPGLTTKITLPGRVAERFEGSMNLDGRLASAVKSTEPFING